MTYDYGTTLARCSARTPTIKTLRLHSPLIAVNFSYIERQLGKDGLSDTAAQVALIISRAMRYTVLPQSDNPSRDKHNQFPHRPEPPAKDFETRVPHLERDTLDRTTRELLADTSSGDTENPTTPVGLIEI